MSEDKNYTDEQKIEKTLKYMEVKNEFSAYVAMKKLKLGRYSDFVKRIKKEKPELHAKFIEGIQKVQNLLCSKKPVYPHYMGADDSK